MRDELLSIWPKDRSVRTLLDLGCRDCWHTAGLPGVSYHVGVDVWQQALERGIRKAQAGGLPGFTSENAEALAYCNSLSDAAFDAVLAIDLLEHLEEKRGLELLDEMWRVAGKLAAVWTTLGYIQQGPFDVDGNPNPYEEHRWGPTPRLFTERKWKVRSYPLWHERRGGALLAWVLK